MITMEEVHILIHENALDEMGLREQRILRQMQRLQDDLDQLGNDIREKKFRIKCLRDAMLRRTV